MGEVSVVRMERPNVRQAMFFEAETRYVAYGGARGGGKSWAVRRKAVLLAAAYPGIRILLVRRSFQELRENHTIPLLAEIGKAATYRDSDKSFRFLNGSRLKLGYCDAEDDALQYQGQEYDVIFIDEATQLTEMQYIWISACCRGANNFPKRIYLTCNPGGVGHGWVKRLFIDRDYRNGENPEDYTFIPAKATDNTALTRHNPEYLQMLDRLPEDLRKAWRDGSWDVFAGQFFPEFDREIHVTEPILPPPEWRRYVSIDYGLDMLAALWIALAPDGRALVYRELYRPDMLISLAAAEIGALSEGENIYEYLAPPDLFARQRESGRTTAELFGEAGILLTKTGNNRVDGWLAVKEALRVTENGPQLKICANCLNLIRCLPQLTHDRHNPNDCASEPHEITHAPDALRGWCTYRSSVARKSNYVYRRSGGVGYGEQIRTL